MEIGLRVIVDGDSQSRRRSCPSVGPRPAAADRGGNTAVQG